MRIRRPNRTARAGRKMACKPPRGVADDRLQRSRLGEEVARAGNDLQGFRTFQPRERLLVELNDAIVYPADDQEGWRANPVQRVAGKVGAPTTGDNGAYLITKRCGSDKSSRCARACAK